MFINFYDFSIGRIGIVEADEKVAKIYLQVDKVSKEISIKETPLIKDAACQLKSYLAGELREFNLPFDPSGTDFMKQVWEKLCEIPYGKTATYKEIAEKVGTPKAARAVGLANNRNPIPIIIPCHRVIGSDGSLTGYRGGLSLKRKLLEIEGVI